ncbi:MAG: HD-GYP domain-containing protein [Pseudomonadota bacterium]
MPDSAEFVSIGIDQLQVGLFITLDLKWLDHQFLTNSFKIKDEKQLQELRALGLRTIRYDPRRSDRPPLPAASVPVAEPPPVIDNSAELAAIERKKARIERLQKLRQSVTQCEKQLVEAATTLKTINQNLYARPQECVKSAVDLVGRMADSLLVDKDLAIHAMNDKVAGEDVYFHSLNVSVLAMMLGKEMGLSRPEIGLIGLGALFHDIGKTKIPDKILRKQTPLTPAEANFLAEHPRYGEEIGRTMKLPAPVIDVILHHHENLDGSGYPDHLDDRTLTRPTRIVAIANCFDNLCNQVNPAKSFTPYEAVSHMFAKLRKQFDPNALSVFIHSMGVYPPGTVVQLNDQLWGMVVSVNVRQPLKPVVLIYDPEVPKEEAILINLDEEPDFRVERTFRPTEIPREVFEYLSPRRRVTYYFGESTTEKPHG